MAREKKEEETTEEETEVTCKLFGQFEADDDSCKVCGAAEQCRAMSESMGDGVGEDTPEPDGEDTPEPDGEDTPEPETEKETPSETEAETEAAPDPVVEKKKQGRPKGSKNKKKDDPAPEPDPDPELDDVPEPNKVAVDDEMLNLEFDNVSLNIEKAQVDKLKGLVEAGLLAFMMLHEALKTD